MTFMMKEKKSKPSNLRTAASNPDDGELTSSGTQVADEELHDFLREKDHMIDMLTKEKNYY
jgi:hypothetical protein